MPVFPCEIKAWKCCKPHAANLGQNTFQGMSSDQHNEEIRSLSDSPFPAYESIPRDHLCFAYQWELDREFGREHEDPMRPWPVLRQHEKEAIIPCIGQPIFRDEMPPEAAWLGWPFDLPPEKYAGSSDIREIMGKTSSEWSMFFADLDRAKRKSTVVTDGNASNWKHLLDEHGNFRLLFSIDRTRPLDEIMKDIRQELEVLHRFPPQMPPVRGVDWASRLCDLLCLRLERSGHDWKSAFDILTPFKKNNGLTGLSVQKHWSTRRGRAKAAIKKRHEALKKRRLFSEMHHVEKYGEPPEAEFRDPLSLFGLAGWQGPKQPIGYAVPHNLEIHGMTAMFVAKPYNHYLATRNLTLQSKGVDWAEVWWDFEDWRNTHKPEYARLSLEGRREHEAVLRINAAQGEATI